MGAVSVFKVGNTTIYIYADGGVLENRKCNLD